jgi:hypothetical protein
MPNWPVIEFEVFGGCGRGTEEFVVFGDNRLGICEYVDLGVAR